MKQYILFVNFIFMLVCSQLFAQKVPLTFDGYFIIEECITKITSDKDVGPRRKVRMLYMGKDMPNINKAVSDSSYLINGSQIHSASGLYQDSASASPINQVIDEYFTANKLRRKELLNPMNSAFNPLMRFNINTADFEGTRLVIFWGLLNIYELGDQLIFFNEASNIVSPLYLVAW